MKARVRAHWIKFLRYLLGVTFSKSDIYIIGSSEKAIPEYLFDKINNPAKEVGEWYDVHIANFYVVTKENTYCNLPMDGKGVGYHAERYWEGITLEHNPITGDQIREIMSKPNRP
jgi:hypothetical protein